MARRHNTVGARAGRGGFGAAGRAVARGYRPRRPGQSAGRAGRPKFGAGAQRLPGVGKPGVGAPAVQKPGLGQPGAAAAKPAAQPQAAVGQHAAPDALYNSQVDLANREGESRLTGLTGQERGLKHEFGIGDPSNPFSRVEGMKRMFLARRKAASAGLAAQGQLYSGTHERALSRTRLEEEQSRAQLRSAFDQAMGGIGNAKVASNFQTEEQKNQAFEDWLARAPQAEDLTTPADEGPAPEAAAPAGAPKPAAAAPKPPVNNTGPGPSAALVQGAQTYGQGAQALINAFNGSGKGGTAAQVSPNSAAGAGHVRSGGRHKGGRARQVGPNKASGRGRIKVRPKARPRVRAGHAGRVSAGRVGGGGFGGGRRRHR